MKSKFEKTLDAIAISTMVAGALAIILFFVDVTINGCPFWTKNPNYILVTVGILMAYCGMPWIVGGLVVMIGSAIKWFSLFKEPWWGKKYEYGMDFRFGMLMFIISSGPATLGILLILKQFHMVA